MKGRTDAMLEKVSLFKPHFTDRFMQKLGHASRRIYRSG